MYSIGEQGQQRFGGHIAARLRSLAAFYSTTPHEIFSKKYIDFLQEIGYYIQVPYHSTKSAEMIH